MGGGGIAEVPEERGPVHTTSERKSRLDEMESCLAAKTVEAKQLAGARGG